MAGVCVLIVFSLNVNLEPVHGNMVPHTPPCLREAVSVGRCMERTGLKQTQVVVITGGLEVSAGGQQDHTDKEGPDVVWRGRWGPAGVCDTRGLPWFGVGGQEWGLGKIRCGRA